MASVFLSYAREDSGRIQPLAAALERAGCTVWWDRHIAGGEEYSGVIEQALESADVVVVAWTATSVRSAWVRDEAAAGRDNGRLVPVTLDQVQPPLGFRQFQTIDLSGWNGRPGSRALKPLVDAIAAKTGSAAPRAASAAAHPLAAGKRGLDVRRWGLTAAGLLVLIFAGTFLYSRVWTDSGAIAPRVAIGGFSLVSSGLPGSLPEMLGQEILAAFGTENAVTVMAPGDRSGESSAPFLVDGSISGLGGSVRFTMNLKNRRSGVLLWSDAYEHEAPDALAARQAAVGASQVIRCALWGAANYEKRMSDRALALYFQWCNEHWSGSTRETAELDAARRVTAAAPDFSFGWSALALAAVPLAQRAGSDEAAAIRKEAEQAAKRSIALDAENPEGYMALAGLLPLDRYAEREALLKKAISVRKTECGCERQAYGDFLASVGRMDEAVEEYERARAMRPLAPFSNLRFAQALYVVGRTDEADRVLSETLELWPQATSLQLLEMKAAFWTGRYDDAIALLRAPDLPLTSDQREALVAAFEALKSNDLSLRARAASELERFADDPRRNDRIVVAALAALGAREAALRAAANLVRSRGLLHADVLFEPNLASARQDPRYEALVRNLGLIAYWRSPGSTPDICRDPARPQFCSSISRTA